MSGNTANAVRRIAARRRSLGLGAVAWAALCLVAAAPNVSAAELLFSAGPQEYEGRNYYWLAEWQLEITIPQDASPDDTFEVLFGSKGPDKRTLQYEHDGRTGQLSEVRATAYEWVPLALGRLAAGKNVVLSGRGSERVAFVAGVRITGDMRLGGDSIYAPGVDVIELRRRMGMVFQKSNPFPMSIQENVIYSLRIDGERNRGILREVCERSLRGAALWDEVKDRLGESALGLSGGQQQRLCIARAIAAEPEVLLMDEPASALDPIATGKIEELIDTLRGEYSLLIVTHNMQQASRISDYTAFMYLGRLIEYGPTAEIFTNPHLKETEDYVTGRFG